MPGFLSGLADTCKKLMAWRDKKRDRDKKIDDFFSTGFQEKIDAMNDSISMRIENIKTDLKEDMTVVNEKVTTIQDQVGILEKKIDVVESRTERIQEGLKRELFESLHNLWRECYLEQHFATINQKQRADDIYDAYHALNGNGSGTDLHDDIKNLPTHDSI